MRPRWGQGVVGLITNAEYANQVVTGGDANIVLIAREFLRDPYFALNAEHALGVSGLAGAIWIRRAPPGLTASGASAFRWTQKRALSKLRRSGQRPTGRCSPRNSSSRRCRSAIRDRIKAGAPTCYAPG